MLLTFFFLLHLLLSYYLTEYEEVHQEGKDSGADDGEKQYRIQATEEGMYFLVPT